MSDDSNLSFILSVDSVEVNHQVAGHEDILSQAVIESILDNSDTDNAYV